MKMKKTSVVLKHKNLLMKKERINCEKAKKIDATIIAKKLGMKVAKKTKNEFWFFYKDEKTASFKIDIRINKWYNFSEGLGGNTLDLIIHVLDCSVSKALEFLNGGIDCFSFHQQNNTHLNSEKQYKILNLKQLQHKALIEYLKSRKINIEIAKKYCQEIHYEINEKKYFAISFKNNKNGFEVRNKFFKGCLGKKGITTINNNSDVVSIFESWSDFLSYLTLKKEIPKENFIILNSTSLVKKTIELLDEYSTIKLFFDNDEAGNKATNFIVENANGKIIDNRIHYKNFDDLNDYLIAINTKNKR